MLFQFSNCMFSSIHTVALWHGSIWWHDATSCTEHSANVNNRNKRLEEISTSMSVTHPEILLFPEFIIIFAVTTHSERFSWSANSVWIVIRSVDEIDTAVGAETCSFPRLRADSLHGKRLIAEMSMDLITVKSFWVFLNSKLGSSTAHYELWPLLFGSSRKLHSNNY